MSRKIQEIFVNHYDDFRKENIYRTRKVCDEEVKKLVRCKDENYGHILYEYPECGGEKEDHLHVKVGYVRHVGK